MSSNCFESLNSLKSESRSGVGDLSWFEVETGEELVWDFLVEVFSCSVVMRWRWTGVCLKSGGSSYETLLLLPRRKSSKRENEILFYRNKYIIISVKN